MTQTLWILLVVAVAVVIAAVVYIKSRNKKDAKISFYNDRPNKPRTTEGPNPPPDKPRPDKP